MPSFDLQVTIDEGSGHLFWKDIHGQDAMALQVHDDLLSPEQNLGCRGCSK